MRAVTTIAAAVLLILFCGTTIADVLMLQDGRIVEGKKLSRAENGVKVAFENGEVLVPYELIEDAIIEGAEDQFTPRTEKEKEMFEKGLVPFEGKWVKPSRRKALLERKLEDRKAYIEDVKEHQQWRKRWKEKSKHFEFEYTVPPHIFEKYRDLMEAYYAVFAKTWKISQPKEFGRLKVCFYTNLEDFHQIGGVGGGVRGYFRFVEPLELNMYYDRADDRYTEEVMFHEVNHYLQKLIDPEFSMPHFPGEAIAEYYGASVWDPGRKKLTVGLIQEGRLAGIQTDASADQLLPLEKMLSTSQMYEHYSYGWALVHMLMNDRSRAKKFEKFVMALVKDRGVKRETMGFGSMKTVAGPEVFRVFKQKLGIKNDEQLAKLEKEWHDYIRDQLKIVSSRGLEKAAEAAARSGRPIRAKRLFKEAIEAGGATAMCHHKFADLLEDDGKTENAIKLWRKAIELDPLIAQFYAALGRALVKKGDEEEGKRLARLAIEIDPDDFWLEDSIKRLLEDE